MEIRSVCPAPVKATPGKYNFLQGAIYSLKLSNIEGRPGLEIYPTLEIVPSNYKTEEFLAHSYVPLEFTQATQSIRVEMDVGVAPVGAGPQRAQLVISPRSHVSDPLMVCCRAYDRACDDPCC